MQPRVSEARAPPWVTHGEKYIPTLLRRGGAGEGGEVASTAHAPSRPPHHRSWLRKRSPSRWPPLRPGHAVAPISVAPLASGAARSAPSGSPGSSRCAGLHPSAFAARYFLPVSANASQRQHGNEVSRSAHGGEEKGNKPTCCSHSYAAPLRLKPAYKAIRVS